MLPPALLLWPARAFATAFASRKLSVWAHELSHAGSALALGYKCRDLDLHGPYPSLTVGGSPTRVHAALIRHTGWVASVLLALLLALLSWRSAANFDAGGQDKFYSETSSAELALLRLVVTLACVWTAAEAVSSDLLSTAVHLNRFFCGNFGMLLLQQASAGKVDGFLRRMLKITMMRGAQSAGVVTYQCVDSSSQTNRVGKRFRVVNGKRTDLSEKLLDRATGITKPTKIKAPQIFQGHTRFATSSIADLSGTHPHQWTKRSRQRYWRDDLDGAIRSGGFAIRSEMRNVESYITHNGDLDFFEIHNITYSIGDVFSVRAACERATPDVPRTQHATHACTHAHAPHAHKAKRAHTPQDPLPPPTPLARPPQ